MGAKGSTQADVPDPLEIAQTDTAFNRIDQFTPTGNLIFSDRPGGPMGANNVATLNLPPELQQLFDSQTSSDQALLDMALGRQQSLEGNLPPLAEGLGFGVEDFDRRRFEEATFERGSELLNRSFDQREDTLRQDLVNRGLLGAGTTEIGEAANTELGNFNQERGDTFERLSLDSILAGGAERDRDLQAAIGTQLTDSNIVDANRSRQFNEMAALLGLQQVAQPQIGNFFTPANADVSGAFALQNQANMANAANATSTQNAAIGAIGQVGGAAMMPSDRRLKKNIKKIGKIAGQMFYKFTYLWGEKAQGVMSDEIPQEFVHKDEYGFDHVDYGGLYGLLTKQAV